MTSLKNHLSTPVGIDLDTFKTGLKELSCENDDLIERFFDRSNHSHNGFLDWFEFLQAIKILTTSDLELKLHMFFSIID